ncbi:MAG: thiolase family protein [Myxococcota bacterium]
MKEFREDIVFLSGKRTPFGNFKGSLKDQTATDLAVHTGKAALEQSGVDPDLIDHVIYGNVAQSSSDAAYLARHVGLRCDIPQRVPALTLNRLCGSGFQSLISGAEQLLLGEAKFILAGGAENMTQVPFVIRGARTGVRLGTNPASDYLWESLTDQYVDLPMGVTAENLAKKFDITREEADEYALRSQQAWANADENGYFDNEIAPIELRGRKGTKTFDTDEGPRPDTTMEKLNSLSPVFDRENGIVTAGNSSGITDGAGSMVMTTADEAEKHDLEPMGRLINWGVSGCDPKIMGYGPVPAINIALDRADMSLDEMELVEVNEAFAAQYLAVEKELGLDRDITNVNGGGVSLGHPLAATGTRIMMHLLYELRRQGKRYGIGSACIGGGQGIAMIVEAY